MKAQVMRVGVVALWGLSLALGAGAGLSGCRGAGSGRALGVDVAKAHAAALQALPASTAWAVTLAPDYLTDAALAEADSLLGVAHADRAPVRKDLHQLLAKRLGFDPTGLSTVTLFALDLDDVGVLLPPGTKVASAPAALPGLQTGTYAHRTVLGPRRLLRALKTAQASAGPTRAAQAGHAKLLKAVRGKPVLVATLAGPGLRSLGLGPDGQFKVQGGLGTVDAQGRQRLALRAPAEGRQAILQAYDAGVSVARLGLNQAKADLDRLDPAAAAAVVYADHRFDAIKTRFRPHEDGDFLTLELPGGQGLGMAFALAGVPAAVAIPAFLKYTRRAKTTEALGELDRMYKGAAAYFATPHVDRAGNVLPCQFPASVGPTPAAGTCCAALGGPDKDGDDRCDSDPSAWSHPTWAALHFQITGPHRYVYAFESTGTGAAAAFTASAYGDLDCDGINSTFQRMGFGAPPTTAGECSLVRAPSPYVENETE